MNYAILLALFLSALTLLGGVMLIACRVRVLAYSHLQYRKALISHGMSREQIAVRLPRMRLLGFVASGSCLIGLVILVIVASAANSAAG